MFTFISHVVSKPAVHGDNINKQHESKYSFISTHWHIPHNKSTARSRGRPENILSLWWHSGTVHHCWPDILAFDLRVCVVQTVLGKNNSVTSFQLMSSEKKDLDFLH